LLKRKSILNILKQINELKQINDKKTLFSKKFLKLSSRKNKLKNAIGISN